MRKLSALVFGICILMVIFSQSSRAMDIAWTRFELLGNYTIQDEGKALGGGVRYTPVLKLAHELRLKTFVGTQYMRGLVKDRVQMVDYGAMAQFHQIQGFIFDFGFGGATPLETGRLSKMMGIVGVEYRLDNPIFDFFDRIVLNGSYFFNRSNTWLINYGLSAAF